MRKKLIVGNWKMHGSHSANAELLAGIVAARPYAADVAVCVPFPYLSETAVALAASDIRWGAQDCSAHDQGAYTGEVSATMLVEFGCRYVIVGHSERRTLHGERDSDVQAKAGAALAAGLAAIVCIGETLAERDSGATLPVIARQLAGSLPAGASAATLVVAYEPVWAIGTGRVASVDQVAEVHALIRRELGARLSDGAMVRILYGGSVKPDNAVSLLGVADVDGALVGGASLDAKAFLAIAAAAPARR